MESKKVIMFPTWKERLEKASLAAIKERRFEEALEKLNKLLEYKIQTQEIYTGKLLCLMELERFEEAQELCETLISVQGPDYYSYIHIYLTLLFQTNQYLLLMEVAEETLEHNDIPDQLRELFQELYTMSKKMQADLNINQYATYIEKLFDMVQTENHQRQWQMIQQLRKLEIAPYDQLTSLLMNNKVHPVNKSAIFLWMQEKNMEEKVIIEKFDVILELSPVETGLLLTNELAKEIHSMIRDVEQEDPIVYKMVKNILKQYLYVLYPMLPKEKDLIHIAQALLSIGNETIHHTKDETESEAILHYKNEINLCSALYTSVIDD